MTADDETRVLLVCTGNQCRSPVAEALLRNRLSRIGVHASVASAGLLEGGVPVPPAVVVAAKELGLDLSDHRSRQLTRDDVASADLVFGMAREHVREAVLLEPAAFPRTFSLRELIRRSQPFGQRSPSTSLREWLARIHEGRKHGDLLGSSAADDIPDPMGGPPAGYRSMVADVADLVDEMVLLGWPSGVRR